MNYPKLLAPSPYWFFLIVLLVASCRQDPAGEQQTIEFKRTDNRLIVRQEAEPDRLNPLTTTSGYSRMILDLLQQYLITVDPETLEYIPQLAEALPEVRPITTGPYAGGASYTFVIRPEAQWDDGSPITAADYVFSLKAALNPMISAPQVRPYLGNIRNVKIDPDNARKFTVIVDEQNILGIGSIGNVIPILPGHIYDPEGLLQDIPLTTFTNETAINQLAETNQQLTDFAETFQSPLHARQPEGVAGSGPYRLEQWEAGQEISVRKKENWWAEDVAPSNPGLVAYPESIIFRPIANQATAVTALKAEEIDVAGNILAAEFVDLQENENTSQRYEFHTPPLMAVYFLSINTQNPKLADKQVRRAIAYAIDVQEIIDNVYEGFGQPVANPVAPAVEYYNDNNEPIEFNIERARTLLENAGWADSDGDGIYDKEINGRRIPLEVELLITAGRETSQQIGLLIQDNARKAGISVDLSSNEYGVNLDRMRRREYEMGSAGRALAPIWNPKQNYHTEGDNRTGFGNAETDALIDSILITFDEDLRNDMYLKLQSILYEQQPEIMLFAPEGRIATHARFEPMITPLFPGYMVQNFRLKKPE